jgi:hypothetical protein
MTKATNNKDTEERGGEAAGLDRRAFLRGIGVGAGAAGVAAVAGTGEAEAAPSDDGRKSVGYSETDHVRRVYDLARF